MKLRHAPSPARRISAAEAAALVRSGMWIDFSAVLAQPDAFDAALAERAAGLTGVKIRACLSTRPRAVLEADPEARHFNWISSWSRPGRWMQGAGSTFRWPTCGTAPSSSGRNA